MPPRWTIMKATGRGYGLAEAGSECCTAGSDLFFASLGDKVNGEKKGEVVITT